MRSKPFRLLPCFFCALLCAACSGRKAVARYEGIDPEGRRVAVALYVPPFAATTPVCLAAAERDTAEMRIDAQPPFATQRVSLYLSRKHYSECGARVFRSVVYWETKAQGPEVCFYRPAARTAETDVVGAWDYCALLQPYRD